MNIQNVIDKFIALRDNTTEVIQKAKYEIIIKELADPNSVFAQELANEVANESDHVGPVDLLNKVAEIDLGVIVDYVRKLVKDGEICESDLYDIDEITQSVCDNLSDYFDDVSEVVEQFDYSEVLGCFDSYDIVSYVKDNFDVEDIVEFK